MSAPTPTNQTTGETVVRVRVVHPDEPAMPPEYEEVIYSTRYPVLRTTSTVVDVDPEPQSGEAGGIQGEDSPPCPWRLKFVDFTPHLAGQNTRRHITSFDKLIDRANTWLQSNKHVDVKTCETVTWCAEELRKLNDTDVVTTTIKRGKIKKTYFMRGLRLWLTPRRDTSDDSTVLGVREYTPDVHDPKSLESFDIKSLVRVANGKIWESPISGDVINIETVLQPTRADVTKDKLSLKVKDTYWTDGAKVDRKYVPIIRMFYALGHRNMNVEIGLNDIVPRVVKQDGCHRYEALESLMVRASEWSVNQAHVSVTNVQTVTYRRRGFSQGVGFPVFWASIDSEDGCVRCVRVAYTKPRTMITLRVLRPHRYCIRKKTFAAKRSPLSIENSNFNSQPDDLRYQSFTKTVDEISRWLDKSGTDVLSVQTLRCQLVGGKYHTSPDSSLVRPSDEKSRELITLVRVYLKASNNSAICLAGPASLFNNPEDRPFWSRPTLDGAVRPHRSRRWRHALIVLVVFGALIIVAIVIFLVIGKTRGWI